MTLDKLAGMVQKGFLEVKSEFKKEIKKLDYRISLKNDSLQMDVNRVERKLDTVVDKQDKQGIIIVNHEKRISKLEKV
jgi:hypothetical protein